MSRMIAGISKEQFDKEAKWVVKFTDRPRICDTYPNLKKILGDDFYHHDNIRDFDILWYGGQPVTLKPFFDKLEEVEHEHGWITIPDFFEKYGVEC